MKFKLFIFLLVSSFAFGQGAVVAPQVALKTVNGLTQPLAGATITVCAQNTGGIPCSPPVVNVVYSDAALTHPLSNPFTADANGNYNFAVAAGIYTVTVTGSGFAGYSYQLSVQCPLNGSCVTSGNGSISPNNTVNANACVQYVGNGGSVTVQPAANPCGVVGSSFFYQLVENGGVSLTQRPALNFTGSGVTCTDNSGQNRTDCTITGGGVGTANPAETHSIAFSATPTFTATSGSAGTVDAFYMTLTGNVTSSTFSGGTPSQYITFFLTQDSAGGHSMVMPSGFNGCTVNNAINSLTVCTYQLNSSGAAEFVSSTDGAGNQYALSYQTPGAGGPPSLSGTPGSCTVSAASQGKLCLSSSANRFAYSYNGGSYTNQLLASDLEVTVASPSGVQNRGYISASDTGSANTYVIAVSPAISAYAALQGFCFLPAHANTGASTLNVNSMGAIVLKKNSGGSLVDPASGDISTSVPICATYTSATPAFVIDFGIPSGGGTSFNPQDTTTRYWRDDFSIGHVGPATATGFGDLGIWASSSLGTICGTHDNWILGARNTGAEQYICASAQSDWIYQAGNGNAFNSNLGDLSSFNNWTLDIAAYMQSPTNAEFYLGAASALQSVSNFIGLRYDVSLGTPDTTFKFICIKGGTSTPSDTGIGPTTGHLYRVSIFSTTTGTFGMTLFDNGSQVATSSSVCTTSGNFASAAYGVQVLFAGSGGSFEGDLDLVTYKQTGIVR